MDEMLDLFSRKLREGLVWDVSSVFPGARWDVCTGVAVVLSWSVMLLASCVHLLITSDTVQQLDSIFGPRRARLNRERASVHFVVLQVSACIEQVVGHPRIQVHLVDSILEMLDFPDNMGDLLIVCDFGLSLVASLVGGRGEKGQ